MYQDENDGKDNPYYGNSKVFKKSSLVKIRGGSNNNGIVKDSSLILKDYSTPNMLKNDKSLHEIEMRKTFKTKPQVTSNKNQNNYEVGNKLNTKR